MSKRKRTTHRRKSGRSVTPPPVIFVSEAGLDRQGELMDLAVKVARQFNPSWFR